YSQDTGSASGSPNRYFHGLVLSGDSPTIACVVVGFKLLSPVALCVTVAILAVVQLFVQLVFFLPLSTDSKARWNLVIA
ncbi:cytochrome C oxidase subunit IV family protein, partial [Francisella tularensis subsp. holarctica]|uniref:cytochrome C oxidase subunit IV family protein n=1 Tax=Francisella tularensis TaxID=263 RepID=UPI0023819A04